MAALGQEDYSNSPPEKYVLRPADRLSISVFREEELSLQDVPVSAEGRISFPLVGTLDVAGLTPLELEAQLEERLGASYLRNPDVTVNVLDYASHLVTVDGQVEEPGVYAFVPGTRLSGGISLAQGPTRVASLEQIAIFRQTDEGLKIAKFDYAAVRAGTMLDPVLMPGDRIVVGTDGLAQFWQDFLGAMPVFALFTTYALGRRR
jgi:polysaccharide export outer membrane protein